MRSPSWRYSVGRIDDQSALQNEGNPYHSVDANSGVVLRNLARYTHDHSAFVCPPSKLVVQGKEMPFVGDLWVLDRFLRWNGMVRHLLSA